MQKIYHKLAKYLLKFPDTLLVNAVVRRLLKRIDNTVIKSRYGYYIHFKNSNSTPIGAIRREVILGRYERDYLAILARLLCPGDYVIDVGAYEGHTSLLFSQAVGDKGKVFAIEPNVENLKTLRDNIELNPVNNIEIIPGAVGKHISKGPLYCKKEYGAYSSLFCYPHLQTEAIAVAVDTLDNLFNGKEYANRIKLIKLDIEGGEADAIVGGTRLIIENKPHIAFEADVTCWAYQKRSIESLFDNIQMLGYDIYTTRTRGRMMPFNLAQFDLFRLRAMNFIATHKSWRRM